MGDFLIFAIFYAARVAAVLAKCPFPLSSNLAQVWLRAEFSRPE